ncbi:MAG: zinc-binding dehydrogenase [Eubacteriaceae bacterium]
MKTKAVRLYGADDLRLEEFELPEIKEDEILVRVVSDSICMSTYKTVKQGKKHKRVPQNVDTHPVIIGHEFAGDIVKVGKKWAHRYKAGDKFAQQPALNYKGSLASPGYSYEYFGGACTYCILPPEVMELGCLLDYDGESYFEASLGEPMSCIIGGYHSNYHTSKTSYDHLMGTRDQGCIMIMGGAGPMGLGAINYAFCLEKKPKLLIVTDISDERIERAKEVIPEEEALEHGITLKYVNTANMTNEYQELMDLTDGKGFDDVFVYVPVKSLVEMADKLLAYDGCLNFFAGPIDKAFSSEINMYNTHYMSTHIMGSTGGTTGDMIEAIQLSAAEKLRPSVMVTHIGGMDSIIDATMNLPDLPGGKKLTYTQFDMPLTAIEDFRKLGETEALFKKLADSCDAHRGLWNTQAEKILFEHFGVA